ncbi:unnamed protein product [Psylliodes chrysocephalus]|uniref:Uncharacterized protein n=1 Tax=Psylliodes chrysocephalus TaxID=3402493 RepID=A0A9P0G8F8_9CUCU|nr:unnamed protein product [Psylliodes chrysocephala]
MITRYRSHYSRTKNSCTRYLPQHLNITTMYLLYTEWCRKENKTTVKESYNRRIFVNEFNLKFHKPHSVTYHTCDRLNNMMIISPDEEVKRQSKTNLTLHQKRVEAIKQTKNVDTSYGKLIPAK